MYLHVASAQQYIAMCANERGGSRESSSSLPESFPAVVKSYSNGGLAESFPLLESLTAVREGLQQQRC